MKWDYKAVHWLAGLDLLWRCIGKDITWSMEENNKHEAVLQVIAQALSEGYAVVLHKTTSGYTLEVKVVKEMA